MKNLSTPLKIIVFCLTLSLVFSINQKCNYNPLNQHQITPSNKLNDQQCPQNSYCSSNNYCVCESGFFGNCQASATYLTGESKQFTITQSISYFIIEPSLDQFVSYQFILCNNQNNESMIQMLNLWVDDGTLITPTDKNALGNDKELRVTQSCIALVTSFFTFGTQPNGQKDLLILGIRLKSPGEVKIQLLVQQVELFGIQIIFRVILFLVCAIALVSLGAVVYCIYKCRRRGTANLSLTEQRNDISFFDQYMPAIKASQHQVKEEICSVCLGQLRQEQQIRHTVCSHYFHKSCLDEWCVTHLSCPICRTSFEKSNLIHHQYLLSSKNSSRLTAYTNNAQQLLQNGIIKGETNLREPII